MKIEIKCPVCRARNTLFVENLECRRCKTDLSKVYEIKRSKRFFLLNYFLNRAKLGGRYATR